VLAVKQHEIYHSVKDTTTSTMAIANDTLSFDNYRRERKLPMAAIESINHPEAAAQARALIAALPETFPLESNAVIPSLSNAELETNRHNLAASLTATPEKRTRELPSAVQPVLTAIGVFLLILVLFKSPVLISQIKYLVDKPAPVATAQAVAPTIIPSEPTITIPKINVQAPVVYEPSTNEATFQKALQNGVVHYGNTAVPGQNGNVAIFGHSSNDWWEPGSYKFVFVLLDKLVPGDKITIDYQSHRYTYEVTASTTVEPTQVSVLDQTPTPTLTLITCTPPGTSWKRLVVTAKQIDPSPTTITTPPQPTKTNATNQLQGAAPGFFQQISDTWNSFTHLFTGSTKSAPAPTSLPASN
jgi:LPXTG-site transpeptidase (sortase) family protein